MTLKCSHIIASTDNRMGVVNYYPCDRKVVAKVTYKSAVIGKFTNENVCKMHLNSTKSYALRLKKRLNYNVELKINFQRES